MITILNTILRNLYLECHSVALIRLIIILEIVNKELPIVDVESSNIYFSK
jgi:hypothetical protein